MLGGLFLQHFSDLGVHPKMWVAGAQLAQIVSNSVGSEAWLCADGVAIPWLGPATRTGCTLFFLEGSWLCFKIDTLAHDDVDCTFLHIHGPSCCTPISVIVFVCFLASTRTWWILMGNGSNSPHTQEWYGQCVNLSALCHIKVISFCMEAANVIRLVHLQFRGQRPISGSSQATVTIGTTSNGREPTLSSDILFTICYTHSSKKPPKFGWNFPKISVFIFCTAAAAAGSFFESGPSRNRLHSRWAGILVLGDATGRVCQGWMSGATAGVHRAVPQRTAWCHQSEAFGNSWGFSS